MNKRIKAILFDLDGTLLPMDQDIFVKAYFGGISKKLAPRGYEPEKLIGAIWSGTKAMVRNNGEVTNEDAFWRTFETIYGEGARKRDEAAFEQFYLEDFDKVKAVCGYSEEARAVIDKVKANGFKVALATNPIFPAIATKKRIAWAGLSHTDFELFTTYENSRYSKPNPDYYRDVTAALGVSAEECLMVGNDVDDDMVAEGLGMKVFLLTDCLINKSGADISVYPRGSFGELIEFIDSL